MRLDEFQQLEMPEQISSLYEDGVYLGKRKDGHLTILLYQLDSFYVEVVYKIYRQHVYKVKCSGTTAILDPYLEQIDVEFLVSEQ